MLLIAENIAQSQDANTAFDVAGISAPASLSEFAEVLHDPDGTLTLMDVSAADRAGQFSPARQDPLNLGLAPHITWSRFTLRNSGAEPQQLVLELDQPGASFVDLYTPNDGGVMASGAAVPYAKRPLPGRSHAFPVEIAPGAVQTYYLRTTTDFTQRLPLSVSPANLWASTLAQEDFAWALVVSLVLVLSLYNLLVFAVTRERDHLLLGLTGVIGILEIAFVHNYAARWIGDTTRYFSQIGVAAIALLTVSYTVLTISFLRLRQRANWARRILLGIMIFAAAAGVIGLTFSPRLGYAMLLGATPVLLVVTLLATIVVIRQGYRPAVYFVIAQLVPIVLGLVQSTALLGIVPWTPIWLTDVPISELFLVVLMSLALADRINIARNEVLQANLALAAGERRLASYLDSLPFGVAVHTQRLGTVYVNRLVRERYLPVPEVQTLRPYSEWREDYPVVIAGSDEPYPETRFPLGVAARGEPAHVDDLAIVRPEGQIPVEVWASPLYDETGQVKEIITAFQDISQRRAIEHELANYRSHLEQRVGDRTAELAAVNMHLSRTVAELSVINEIGRSVARVVDLMPTLDEVTHVLAKLYDAPYAAIGLVEPGGQSLRIASLSSRSDSEPLFHRGGSLLPLSMSASALFPSIQPIIVTGNEFRHWFTEAADPIGAQLKESLIAPLIVREEVVGMIAIATDNPVRSFTEGDRSVAQTIAGQVAAAIDTARLIDEVRRQRDTAQALQRTTAALSQSLDQKEVLNTIFEQLRQVFEYEGAAVDLVQDDVLVVVDARGLNARYLGQRIPLAGAGASVSVLQRSTPLLIADTRVCDQWEHWVKDGVRSWMGAPLVSRDGAIGVLSLSSAQVNSFSKSQVDLLTTFADQATVAVVNARLHQQAQLSAASEERHRIARELHDAVTQTIFSSSLIAASLPAHLGHVPAAAQADLDALQLLTKAAIAEMRTLLLELRPENLVEASLDLLIPQLADAYAARMGVRAEVTCNCDAAYKPPYPVKIAVYRIAQEALNNVAKHAGAARVTINLTVRGQSLHLAVIDDGRGFDANAVGAERMGLAIMRERAAEIGAVLTIDSEPGLGTHLFLGWNDEQSN